MSDPATGPRVGLSLCGGGITGAMYQVGCLAALEEHWGDERGSFEAFVGASSGATVATALAAGIPAQRMYRALLDPADDFFPLQRHHLLRFDSMELKRVLASVLGAGRRAMTSAASKPLQIDLWNEIDRFYDSLPAGLFTLDAYEDFLRQFMARRGIPDRFSQMPAPLAIVAHDLDAGTRAVFGRDELSAVPVRRAIAATSAVPVLYAPVRIGTGDYVAGGVGENGHADIAIEMGCDLIFIINPLVPVRTAYGARSVPTGHGRKSRVRDKGLLWVYNQGWRIQTEARLQSGLATFRAAHPDAGVVLLEPSQDDATMFMHSPMNFAARRAILQEAYTSTTRMLRDPSSPVRRAIDAHATPAAPQKGDGAPRKGE